MTDSGETHPTAAAMNAMNAMDYDQTTEIRQLLIDYLITEGTIDPASFFEESWKLTRDGAPVFD